MRDRERDRDEYSASAALYRELLFIYLDVAKYFRFFNPEKQKRIINKI